MSEGVRFTKSSAVRIANVVNQVEVTPLVGRSLRRNPKIESAAGGNGVAFWGRIVLEGPDSGDVDYNDYRYWVVEQSYSISGSTITFSEKEGGRHITAINLAEATLPSYISDTHNITKPALEYDWDEDSGDSSSAPNIGWYEENVIVPIFKLSAGGSSVYIFNLLRGQFVEEYFYGVETVDDDGCPGIATWNKRKIMAWDYDQINEPGNE